MYATTPASLSFFTCKAMAIREHSKNAYPVAWHLYVLNHSMVHCHHKFPCTCARERSLVLTAGSLPFFGPSSQETWVTGMVAPFPLSPDEKNGIPNSPQKAALTLDLGLEKEPEPEPDEPLKPEIPSVFIVFQKVWLRDSNQTMSLGRGTDTLPSPPQRLLDQNEALVVFCPPQGYMAGQEHS